MTIEFRQLGQTGIKITPIGLGVMQFAGGKGMFRVMYPELSQDTMNSIIKTAREGGINWFDTAEMYGAGRSERSLALALQANDIKDGDVIVATKWWPLFRAAGNMRKTVNVRQQCLHPYGISLYQVHQPISFSSPEDEMNVMADLVEAGLIRSVGVSNFDAERMRRAHTALHKRGLSLASNQVQYNLLDRSIEKNGVLEAARELGITIIAWGPLASGILTGKYHKNPEVLKDRPFARRMRLRRRLNASLPLIDVLESIAGDHQVTIAQVALNWLIHAHGDTVVAIPGATTPRQVEANAHVMVFRLSPDEISRISQASKIAAFH